MKEHGNKFIKTIISFKNVKCTRKGLKDFKMSTRKNEKLSIYFPLGDQE